MKNFFKHIEYKYDKETCKMMKAYCNEIKRLALQKERLVFLLTCRSYGIIPRHTSNMTTQVKKFFQCNTIKEKLGKVEYNFHKKILDLEVSQTNTNIKLTKRKMFHLDTNIANITTAEDHENFITKQNNRSTYLREQARKTQTHKIDTLKEKHFKKYDIKLNDHWFENKTSVDIPKECKWILSLGKKFALPVDKDSFSAINVIADIEQCIQNVDSNADREKDTMRTKLAHRITTFKRNIKNTPRDKFILAIYKRTKSFLKKHKDIIIIQSDKGNKTVALYKKDYMEKMEKLLEDKNTYRTSRIDPTIKLQKENNNHVNNLHRKKYIDAWQKKVLTCTAAAAPRLYGLPKIHKIDIPLRPIVSSSQVPCYQLAKHMGQILRHTISERYNVKNSFELKANLEKVLLEENDILVSFDVISLFTNIPVHSAIRTIMQKWSNIEKYTKIPKSVFLELLKFCLLDNNYFLYGNKLYNQIFGMPMGNPLSPTIADIILDNLLDDAITELLDKNIKIKYISKYVDDILAIIKKDDLDVILATFNKFHPKIKFTVEVEKNREISYLDTRLIRGNTKIIFDWYSKETASGRIMNYNSTQPLSQIMNTARNLTYRVLKISDTKFHHKNTQLIRKILIENSFPQTLISNIIETTKQSLKNNKQLDNTAVQEKKVFYGVQYIPGLTDNKNIKTIINKNTNIAYKPNRTLNTIFTKVKAPIGKEQQCNVVYEIKCKGNDEENCNMIYIGTTKRTLATRLTEHKLDITKQKESTALAQHVIKTNHKPDFEKVNILDREKIEKKRYTKESLHIQQKIKNTMNMKEDTDNINASYMVAII